MRRLTITPIVPDIPAPTEPTWTLFAMAAVNLVVAVILLARQLS